MANRGAGYYTAGANGMMMGEQPSKKQVAETYPATEPTPLTMDPTDIHIPVNAESLETQSIDLDTTLESKAPLL